MSRRAGRTAQRAKVTYKPDVAWGNELFVKKWKAGGMTKFPNFSKCPNG
jgi:hypothetical protein